MHHDLHTPILEELNRALAHVFEVGGAGGDDVDYAEDALFGRMRMGMVVIVV